MNPHTILIVPNGVLPAKIPPTAKELSFIKKRGYWMASQERRRLRASGVHVPRPSESQMPDVASLTAIERQRWRKRLWARKKKRINLSKQSAHKRAEMKKKKCDAGENLRASLPQNYNVKSINEILATIIDDATSPDKYWTCVRCTSRVPFSIVLEPQSWCLVCSSTTDLSPRKSFLTAVSKLDHGDMMAAHNNHPHDSDYSSGTDTDENTGRDRKARRKRGNFPPQGKLREKMKTLNASWFRCLGNHTQLTTTVTTPSVQYLVFCHPTEGGKRHPNILKDQLLVSDPTSFSKFVSSVSVMKRSDKLHIYVGFDFDTTGHVTLSGLSAVHDLLNHCLSCDVPFKLFDSIDCNHQLSTFRSNHLPVILNESEELSSKFLTILGPLNILASHFGEILLQTTPTQRKTTSINMGYTSTQAQQWERQHHFSVAEPGITPVIWKMSPSFRLWAARLSMFLLHDVITVALPQTHGEWQQNDARWERFAKKLGMKLGLVESDWVQVPG